MPVGGERKIDTISFYDSNWNAFQQTPKYGQTLNVRIETINMLGETLRISLWERDTYSDTGHDPEDNTNIWGNERSIKVQNPNGKVEFSFVLNPSWAIVAGRGIFEGSEHEYYLLVKGFGATTKFSTQRNVSDEVVPLERPPNRPSEPPVPPTPNRAPGISPTLNSTPAPAHPQAANTHNQEPVRVGGTGINPPAPSGGVSPAVVNEVKVEGIIDAYFAKKGFTKKTGEEASTFEYPVASNGNRTTTDAEKDSIAGIILDKPSVKALKDKKEYTTKEAIKAGLIQNEYNNGDKVTFKTFKLGEEFIKIASAPLEEKVYLVATSYFLEGKTATITVKEKDGIIMGAADSVLPISQISEEKNGFHRSIS